MKKEMHISLLKKLWNDRHLSVREQLFEYADELSPYEVIHNVLKFRIKLRTTSSVIG